MNARLCAFTVALALLASPTALAQRQAPNPVHPNPLEKPILEMVFVIDTTGSMGGLIDAAKQKVWAIVNDVMKSASRPSVRVGLVAYRDHGDAYVTKVLPLTRDLDRVYTTLMEYQAQGGGDTPEDVRRALHDGVAEAGWSKRSPHIAQVLFLVGDAPPHEDYTDEPDVLTTTAQAVKAGLVVDTIQCGSAPDTQEAWRKIALRGEGQYFAIEQNGGVQSMTTPYDRPIAALGRKLGGTFAAYGGGAGPRGVGLRADAGRRAASTESMIATGAPGPAGADRALNKALNADAYEGDLYQSIESGRVQLKDVRTSDLPDSLQLLSPADRSKAVAKQLAARKALRAEILRLSRLRDANIAAQRRKQAKPGDKESFDVAVLKALREQIARKGIRLRG